MKRLLIIASLICGSAQAEFKDGNKLFSQMNQYASTDWFNAMGYITGVADTTYGVLHCAPANVTGGQLFDMVKSHMESYPGLRHFSADTIVTNVLKTSWPCPKKGNAL